MIVGRNKLQQIRDATEKELLHLAPNVMQTAIENIETPSKWFNKSAYYQATEEITLSAMFQGIEVGGQSAVAVASITQTSEYYLYTNFHVGTLSARLHGAANSMQQTVNNVLTTHIKNQTTWKRVQKSLNKANVSIGDVPKWLTELEQAATYFGSGSKEAQTALKKAKRALSKLRPDRDLRKAYQRAVEAVERTNFDAIALKNAMKKAVVSKISYNNERIARSELGRAYNDAFWRRVKDDPEITLVRSVLSSGHKIPDQCDHIAEVDAFGLGAGVYPADKAYSIPYHSNCLCMYEPIIRHIDDRRRGRFSQERYEQGLDNFTPSMQRTIKGMGEPKNPHALPKSLVD